MSAGGLAELLGDIRLNVSGEAVSQIGFRAAGGISRICGLPIRKQIFPGWENPSSDILETEEAQNIFRDAIREIIRENADAMVTGGTAAGSDGADHDRLSGIRCGAGYTDPDRFAEYLMEYLQTATRRL